MVVFYDKQEALVVDNDTVQCRILHREWNPPPGYTPPPGTLWEIIADDLPFVQKFCMGAGGDREEAIRIFTRMYKLLKEITNEKNKD